MSQQTSSQESPDGAPADPAPTTSTAPSATAATPAAIAIPEDFPLSDGMASEDQDDVSISSQSVGMRALDLCGRKPLRGLEPADRLAAEASGNEYSNTRDLMLFADTDRDRLKIPFGHELKTGDIMYLDIKEGAEFGAGPHGMLGVEMMHSDAAPPAHG